MPVPVIPPPLTPKQVDGVMQSVTLALLGLPDNAYGKVRVGWQQQGQPTGTIDEDVAYVRCSEDDDEINRTRDVEYQDVSPTTVAELSTYHRVWRVMWTLYGPNSFDNARKLRSGLYTQVTHDIFAVRNVALYTVMDLEAPRRVPEFVSGQWWERVDFECQFNELTTERVDVNAVASTEVLVYTEKSPDIDSPALDIVVTKP